MVVSDQDMKLSLGCYKVVTSLSAGNRLSCGCPKFDVMQNGDNELVIMISW